MTEEIIYKNSSRESEGEIKPYVPQYKTLGLQPEDKVMIKQGSIPLPGVGNIQNSLFEYNEYNEDYSNTDKIIDNNDFVDVDNLQIKSNVRTKFPSPKEVKPISSEDGKYILIWNGDIICISSLEEVQEQTRKLVFGEHEKSPDKPVSINDINVLKKVKIKVGLFLDEED